MAKVLKTKQVDSSPAEVWERIGDFHGLHTWVKGIPQSEADGNKRKLGAGDNAIVEELMEEAEHSYTYRILKGPLPVKDYVATLRVKEASGGSLVEWEANFEPSGVPEDQAVAIIGGVFDAGLGNL